MMFQNKKRYPEIDSDSVPVRDKGKGGLFDEGEGLIKYKCMQAGPRLRVDAAAVTPVYASRCWLRTCKADGGGHVRVEAADVTKCHVGH
jgi:hypothetical protein